MFLQWIILAVAFATVSQALRTKEYTYFMTDETTCGMSVSIDTSESDTFTFSSNGIPNHEWGCNNPNVPSARSYEYVIAADPEMADTPYAVPLGGVTGFAINGVPFFNPLTSSQENAVEGDTAETFDCCGGHSDVLGRYHYHTVPTGDDGCTSPIVDDDDGTPQMLGVALDGFPIYVWGNLDEEDLDECHGAYLNNGQYAYIAKRDHFPYIMGCYWAQPSNGDGINTNSKTCEDAAYGGLCYSGKSGAIQVSGDDVTTESKKRTMSMKEKDLKELLHIVQDMAAHKVTKRDVKRSYLRMTSRKYADLFKRASDSTCYLDSCSSRLLTYDEETGTC